MRSRDKWICRLTGALLLAGVLGVLPAPASQAGSRPAERGFSWGARATFVPSEVIVGFRGGTSRAEVARAHTRVPARVTQRFAAFRMELVTLAPGVSVSEAVRRYTRDPAVAFAEPNYLRYPTADLFPDLWGLNNTGQSHPVADADGDDTASPSSGSADADIDAPEAWATEQGDGTVVAVLDTGVDVTHPDLSGQLWTNPGESSDPTCAPNCETDGIDNDGNGLADDVHGWDFADDDDTLLAATSFEGFEHGTHVAGTIAGDNDGDGVVGVCPGCKIMVLKIAHDSDGSLDIASEIAALNYAKSKGVRIANMSFGGPVWVNSEREAIRTSGLLAVAAAGNDALDNDMFLSVDVTGSSALDLFSPFYPASFTLNNIIVVGASNDHDENGYSTECFLDLLFSKPECAFTNWGHDSVDVSAPGVDVESAAPGGGHLTWDGTSMAAPHVAGIAGLVLSQHPTYTVAQLKNTLMRSVDKPATLKTLYLPSYVDGIAARTRTGAFTRTAGRVNANTALTASTANATPLTDGNLAGAKLMRRGTVTGSVSWPADINDVWKRRLTKGHLYRIKLVVPAGRDYDLFVWKPRSKEIWQPGRLQRASRRIGSGDEVVQFVTGSTGTYYFHVSAWLFKSGGYKLSIKRIV